MRNFSHAWRAYKEALIELNIAYSKYTTKPNLAKFKKNVDYWENEAFWAHVELVNNGGPGFDLKEISIRWQPRKIALARLVAAQLPALIASRKAARAASRKETRDILLGLRKKDLDKQNKILFALTGPNSYLNRRYNTGNVRSSSSRTADSQPSRFSGLDVTQSQQVFGDQLSMDDEEKLRISREMMPFLNQALEDEKWDRIQQQAEVLDDLTPSLKRSIEDEIGVEENYKRARLTPEFGYSAEAEPFGIAVINPRKRDRDDDQDENPSFNKFRYSEE